MIGDDAAPPSPKRGRGRPRKVAPPEYARLPGPLPALKPLAPWVVNKNEALHNALWQRKERALVDKAAENPIIVLDDEEMEEGQEGGEGQEEGQVTVTVIVDGEVGEGQENQEGRRARSRRAKWNK